jgi:hypothetical protein
MVVEPSNPVVATDLKPEVAPADVPRPYAESRFTLPPGLIANHGRARWIAGASIGAVLLIAASVAAFGGHARGKRGATSRAVTPPAPTTVEVAPPAVAAAAPPAIARVPEPTAPLDDANAAPAAPAAAAAVDRTPIDKTIDSKKQRLGKFTIKAEPKIKNVWFDGKRMLGTGQRSFLVLCGMHTVAVNDKADNRDIEIPCNGEYTVSK